MIQTFIQKLIILVGSLKDKIHDPSNFNSYMKPYITNYSAWLGIQTLG